MNTHRVNETSMSLTVRHCGYQLNTKNGELRDPINDQIDTNNINQKLLDYDAPNFLCLEFEKIKSIYIPKLTIGEKKSFCLLYTYQIKLTKYYSRIIF